MGLHMGPDPTVTTAASFTSDATLKWPLTIQLGQIVDGGALCTSVYWVGDDHVVCTVSAGYGGPHDVIVTVGDQSVSASGLFSYAAPEIMAISPSFIPFTGSEVVEVVGSNFFPACIDNKFRTRPCDQSWLASKSDPLAILTHVYIGGENCMLISVTENRVTCMAPPGEGRVSVEVDAAGFRGVMADGFEYRYRAHHVEIETTLPAEL